MAERNSLILIDKGVCALMPYRKRKKTENVLSANEYRFAVLGVSI